MYAGWGWGDYPEILGEQRSFFAIKVLVLGACAYEIGWQIFKKMEFTPNVQLGTGEYNREI